MSESLDEALPKEQARVRELIRMYRDPMLQGSGEFAARMMEASLQAADKAVISGDVVEMIQAFQDLKTWTE
jgi:hypothetical protein